MCMYVVSPGCCSRLLQLLLQMLVCPRPLLLLLQMLAGSRLLPLLLQMQAWCSVQPLLRLLIARSRRVPIDRKHNLILKEMAAWSL